LHWAPGPGLTLGPASARAGPGDTIANLVWANSNISGYVVHKSVGIIVCITQALHIGVARVGHGPPEIFRKYGDFVL